MMQRPIAFVHPKVLREIAERGGHVVGCVERQILSRGRLGRPNLEDVLDLLDGPFLVVACLDEAKLVDVVEAIHRAAGLCASNGDASRAIHRFPQILHRPQNGLDGGE